MRLDFLSTSTFRQSLQLLKKRPEAGYSHCCADICSNLKDLTFDHIYSHNFLVREMGNVRVIKLRVANSNLNLSSAAGYRVILVCNRKYNHVCFLEVYPKKGKYSKIDLTKGEYKLLLSIYAQELKSGELRKLNIEKQLELMD